MKIVVIGAGGLGGYFAGRWAASGLDVSLIARGAHLEAIKANGLQIESPLGDATVPIEAASHGGGMGPADLVLIATKTWQLAAATELLPPLLGPTTRVMGVQNGVEAAEVLAAKVGAERVLAGTCRIISYLSQPGVVHHVGVQPTLIFGPPRGGNSEGVPTLETQLSRGAGMTVRSSPDIEADLWRKFLFFAPTSGIGSVAQAPIGVLREIPESRAMLHGAIEEVVAIGRVRGVRLEDDSTAKAMTFIDSLPPEGTSSMQRDVRDGRRTELEALSGAVVRLGQEHGQPTPIHRFIYGALLPLEMRARHEVSWP